MKKSASPVGASPVRASSTSLLASGASLDLDNSFTLSMTLQWTSCAAADLESSTPKSRAYSEPAPATDAARFPRRRRPPSDDRGMIFEWRGTGGRLAVMYDYGLMFQACSDENDWTGCEVQGIGVEEATADCFQMHLGRLAPSKEQAAAAQPAPAAADVDTESVMVEVGAFALKAAGAARRPSRAVRHSCVLQ